MADNVKQYGIRWSSANGPGGHPKPLTGFLATAYQGAINGGTNVHVRPGDPLTLLNSGYWAICQGVEASGANGLSVDGICVGVHGYKDAASGLWGAGPHVPGATAYTDLQAEGSKLAIIPACWGLWEIDCDDKTSATTYAAYHAFIGENCDHVLPTGSEPKANPMLDISAHSTSTQQWRIWGISESAQNRYYDGLYVKLIVSPNESIWPGFSTAKTGV